SFRATVVSGDMKGRVGVGIAKGEDVAQAVEKAKRQAQKNMIRVPMLNDTIPYEVEAKYGSSRVLLRPQRKGRGLVAGGAAREVCEKAGIRDVSAKFISKTHNSLNNARVTIEALKKLRVPVQKEAVAVEEQPVENANTQPATTEKAAE
ncbi:MAG: 30S ribosomal protein S5, partial [archaeon]|nr:30S ribosomal protein S5 [archaeon]